MKEICRASLAKRSLAFFIDYLIFCTFQLFLFFGSISVLSSFNYSELKDEVLFKGILISTMINFIMFTFKDAFHGMSIGRRITGIAVRDKDDFTKTPNILKLLFRNILLIFWPIELVVLCFNINCGKRIGDILTKTDVIETK